jgi:hypothetical protein
VAEAYQYSMDIINRWAISDEEDGVVVLAFILVTNKAANTQQGSTKVNGNLPVLGICSPICLITPMNTFSQRSFMDWEDESWSS